MSDALPILPALLFSVVVHELAHGWVALRLGDPTARDAGRLTLNFQSTQMYDFQIVEDANIALDVLNSRLARQRLWRA